MARRFIRSMAAGLAVVTAVLTTAGPASAAPRLRPTHWLDCDVSAVEPFQYYRGTIVYSNAHITCTSAPDVSNTTNITWRYDGGGKYTKFVYKTSNQVALDWWLMAQKGCDYSRAFPMHTQVLIDYFHGNWAHEENNSETVTMYC